MFRRTDPADCTILWDGTEIPARAGEMLAATLLAAGVAVFRHAAADGAPRGPFCLMGACYDCLVVVEGAQNRQACQVAVTPGMHAAPQPGRRVA